MMSLGQKVVALGVILVMNLLALWFSPILGVLALFGLAPLAVVIVTR